MESTLEARPFQLQPSKQAAQSNCSSSVEMYVVVLGCLAALLFGQTKAYDESKLHRIDDGGLLPVSKECTILLFKTKSVFMYCSY